MAEQKQMELDSEAYRVNQFNKDSSMCHLSFIQFHARVMKL